MRPALRLLLIAAVATAASVWPVLFAGKSFVSPNFGTRLLYQDFPTVPGSRDAHTVELHGSDVGAALWQDVPYSAIEHRSLLRDHALPRWNRYGACGAPLLAQGQSMFGDPLHLLPILTGGAAWAWDAKFVLAKLLFAFGIGLLALELTDDVPIAAVCAVAAPFIGFFAYRINHPAFFSVCYSPWILVGALRVAGIAVAGVADPGRTRTAGVSDPGYSDSYSLVLWFIADWALLCSGTVKEAYGLLAILNLVGLAYVAATSLRRAAAAAGMIAVFLLVSSPLWRPVLALVRSSYITNGTPHISLLPPGLALGLFDEAFFRPFVDGDVFGPALNFVFLAGCLYALACWRTLLAAPSARITLLATAFVALLDFGLVPPAWLARLPFIGSVGSLDNVLGCALLPLLAALAALGFASARRRLPTDAGGRDLANAALLLLGLVVLHESFGQVIPRMTHSDGSFGLIHAAGPVPIPAYLIAYYVALVAALLLAGLAARCSRPRRGRPPLGLARDKPGSATPATGDPAAVPRGRGFLESALATGGLILTGAFWLWQGLPRAENGHPSALSSLRVAFPSRADFRSPRSAAISAVLRRTAADPARTVGLGVNLFPGWSAFYGLENISGPDAIMNPAYRALTDAMALDRRMDWMLCVDSSYLPRQRRYLDFFNVRYYLDHPSNRRPHAGLRLAQAADLDVYESPTAWPRAFYAAAAVRGDGAADLVRRLDSGDGAPFAMLAGAELDRDARLAALLHARPQVVPASAYRLRENSTAFSLAAPAPGLAVLTEADWPGYPHVELDGRPVPAVRANVAFIGVYVPAAGAHRIVVRYFF